MCSFEIPLLLWYTHIPVLIASIVFGAFIFLADKKSPINRNLLAFTLFFCFWVVSSLLQWVMKDPKTSLFLQQLSIFEFISIVFFVYFTYAFVGIVLNWKKKLLLFLPFIPMLLLAFTSYNLTIDSETCDTETGYLYIYVALLTMIYLIKIISLFVKKYKETENQKIRNQIKIIIGSIAFFIIWFLGFSYIIDLAISYGYGDYISQFMPFGMLVFLGMLTYAITKYQLFNIKLIAAQALTITIWILIGSQFFFAQDTINYLLIALTLAVAIVFGIMLIRSVRLEIERKEELQKISDALVIANSRLKELDTAKSEFISIASHQLRTPLTAIKGYVSLLLEGSYGQVPAPIQDVLNKIYSVNSRLVQLVEDLLNVSRIEAGRIQYNFQPTHIEPIIAELVDMFAITAKDRHLELKMRLAKKPLPEMTIDPNKIKEVVSNLIDNALKYTKEGSVTVSVEADERAARIIVSDTGIGIKPEDKDKLFDKFIRTKETTKLFVSGTGLGLYVGKNFVEAHGGKIWSESPCPPLEGDGEGKGSRFIIELPFVNPKIHIGTSDQASFSGQGK